MHENSLTAWKEHNPTLNNRCFQVFSAIHFLGVATDLEIMQHLGFTDPNKVRPRVTDLKKAGLIFELAEKKINPESGIKARQVCAIGNEPVTKKETPAPNLTEEIKPEPMVQDSLFELPTPHFDF